MKFPIAVPIFFMLTVLVPVGASAAEWALDRALAHVRDENPDVRVAALRIQIAEAQLREAQSQLWPRLLAETGYTVTDNPPAAFMMLLNQRQLTFDRDFNHPGSTDNWGSEIRLEYPLYTGGGRKAAISAAILGVDAARHSLEATREQLELEVAKAFFEISRARAVASAAGALLNRQRSNLELAQKLEKEKVALRTAVLDLETKVAEAEAQFVLATNARDIQIAYLKSLLGLEGTESFTVAKAIRKVADPHASAALPRAEIRALQERTKQAAALVDRAKAERRPTVQAFASAREDDGFNGHGGASSWLAGVSVRLKIWDGGEARAKVGQARAAEAIARQNERKQRLAIDLQTKTARLAVDVARKRAVLGRSAIRSAAEGLKLTRQRFEEGLALSTELVDAEATLTFAQVRLAEAEAEEQIALASLRHALGLPIRTQTGK